MKCRFCDDAEIMKVRTRRHGAGSGVRGVKLMHAIEYKCVGHTDRKTPRHIVAFVLRIYLDG